jgi:DNA mismatch repair protein MutL
VGRVHTLPEEVINQIAAGEVVERPASVVKELLENALDAQAHRIKVAVQGGGTERIQVDDDGMGMDADDAVSCFQRHATSKLRTLADLEQLRSMGFRGEALPSIAAVSRLQMVTRGAEEVAGTRVCIDGGEILSVEACGAPPGTSFQVSELFYNTPARLKFLKSPVTEAGQIAQCFTVLALAAPDVHMTLHLNGRLHTQAPAAASLGERLDLVFGAGFQDNLLAVEATVDGLQVQGFIAKATFHRATRRQQLFFVNARPVHNRALSHALYEAYRTLLPRDRHPVAFLFFTLPPGDVDVNVHPAKLEVRFRQEQRLYDSVRRLLQQRLQESLSGTPVAAERASMATPAERAVPLLWRPSSPSPASAPAVTAPPPAERGLGLYAGYPAQGQTILEGRPLGQLHETYILVQYPDGVFIVDQHAAHERVVYERLLAQQPRRDVAAQRLLFPVTLDLGGTDSAWLEASLPRLASLGFTLEPFGGSTYRLHSVPALLAERDHTAALMDVLEVLRTPTPDDALAEVADGVSSVWQRLLTVMACHGAIRAGQRLQDEEMRILLQNLAQTPRPFTCPHGRPVLLNVALAEIEKKFLRR